MSDDRLILVDRRTGRALTLADYGHSTGWEPCAPYEITDYLQEIAMGDGEGDLCVVRESVGGYEYVSLEPFQVRLTEERNS